MGIGILTSLESMILAALFLPATAYSSSPCSSLSDSCQSYCTSKISEINGAGSTMAGATGSPGSLDRIGAATGSLTTLANDAKNGCKNRCSGGEASACEDVFSQLASATQGYQGGVGDSKESMSGGESSGSGGEDLGALGAGLLGAAAGGLAGYMLADDDDESSEETTEDDDTSSEETCELNEAGECYDSSESYVETEDGRDESEGTEEETSNETGELVMTAFASDLTDINPNTAVTSSEVKASLSDLATLDNPLASPSSLFVQIEDSFAQCLDETLCEGIFEQVEKVFNSCVDILSCKKHYDEVQSVHNGIETLKQSSKIQIQEIGQNADQIFHQKIQDIGIPSDGWQHFLAGNL